MSIVTRLTAAGVVAAAMTASANASAHFYGVLINSNVANANDGASVFIQTDVLHSTCNSLTHTFVNHELWYGVVAGAAFWVEVGFKDGATDGIGCVSDADFWADNRNGGGYNEHYPNNGWTLGDWYAAEITSSGSCQWAVILGGLRLGTSTANCPGTNRYVAGGIEATNQGTGSVKGFLDGWAEQNSPGGTFVQGWEGAGLFQNQPPFIEFLSGSETEEVHNESF